MYRFTSLVALLALLLGFFQLTWIYSLLGVLLMYLITGGWRTARIWYLTFPRDLKRQLQVLRFVKIFSGMVKKNMILADVFNETMKKYGDKTAIIFEDKKWTFEEVDAYCNKVANYFQSIGYKKGDVVALFLENRPELVFLWLGLSKIGVISALINSNLKKQQLIHCVSIVDCKGLVFSSDPDISRATSDVQDSLKNVQLFEFGDITSFGNEAENLLEKLKDTSDKQPVTNYKKESRDILLYVYTSGTTGSPKACVIRNFRYMSIVLGFGNVINKFGPNEVLYNTLPLYHTSGGIIGVGVMLAYGTAMVVRRKFSASQFWNDIRNYNATCFIYIGEVCRYIMAQPPKDVDKTHSVKFILGNGLRQQLWKGFQERFNIPAIHEFYGATEGNIGLVNTSGASGAVGSLFASIPSVIIPQPIFVKMDESNEEIQRGADGHCLLCKPGEIGQMLGRIKTGKKPVGMFDGYLNKSATSKKIARDVLEKGDEWFLTGDTAYYDELGNIYFHDRIGDTFRWQGENVSTTELEGVMINILGLNSIVVVGVEIPGCEGRAGLAAIEDPDDVMDISGFGKLISQNVASYARPVFLRIMKEVEKTGTFKFKKTKLRKEGFDLNIVTDKMFYFDRKSNEYRLLTKEIHEQILNSELRL